jgi:hypothetical protein
MKKIVKIIMTVVILMSFSNVKLVTKYIFDNQVSIKVPSNFKAMTKQEMFRNFPRANAPSAVFVDKTNSVYITFVLQQNKKATQKDIEKYKDYYVELNDYFGKCDNSGFFENNNKKFGYISVDGLKMKQKPIYLAMSFTDVAGMILECKFYCPADQKEQWKDTAKEIIKSFTITVK